MTKRYTVTVTDTQAAWLEEIAAHDEVSVSFVVRDVLRAQLPNLVELKRWLDSDEGAPNRDQALALLGSLDALHSAIGEGSAVVGAADVALPARRKSRRNPPPSSNTGANSPLGG